MVGRVEFVGHLEPVLVPELVDVALEDGLVGHRVLLFPK
jgi:hypothetical protein